MDQKELERKAQLFDWLATRIAYAEIRLSFGGRHKAYVNCDPKKLEAEIEEANDLALLTASEKHPQT